jgi:hypothetical protein
MSLEEVLLEKPRGWRNSSFALSISDHGVEIHVHVMRISSAFGVEIRRFRVEMGIELESVILECSAEPASNDCWVLKASLIWDGSVWPD